ncbi:glycosyltransferase family 4 protein [Arthrobacter sp. 35W]|uniref:glycosyltransferase family 4 protein n=1 Tax=Arthrobacter sp. 35W TaxID=1132441 RepID=UPI0018CBCB1D|nr:glycosyltransferase family 4 protein [Arthrobacter sp. 35W]
MHSYIRGLAGGQTSLGLDPMIIDNVQPDGQFNLWSDSREPGTIELSTLDVLEYHLAYSARPILAKDRMLGRHPRRVMHFHGPWYSEGRAQGNSALRSAAKWLYEADTYRRFDSFITASDAFAKALSRGFGVSPNRITTVYPGVDLERFNPSMQQADARKALGIDPDRLTFSCVRRLEPRMGIHLAIEAMENFPQAQLVIAGIGSLKSELESKISMLGLSDRVFMLGRVPDEALVTVYRAADVVLVPTTSLEGFGMIVLEAMASGIPVVSSRVGGLPEAMGPFANDWCFEPGSVDSLSDAIRRALKESEATSITRAYAETRSFSEMAKAVEAAIAQS